MSRCRAVDCNEEAWRGPFCEKLIECRHTPLDAATAVETALGCEPTQVELQTEAIKALTKAVEFLAQRLCPTTGVFRG